MILLSGLRRDPPLLMVYEALLELGAPALLLEQDRVAETTLELLIDGHVGGELLYYEQSFPLPDFTALYLRPHDAHTFIPSDAEDRESLLTRSRENDDILLSWAELTPELVLNRPESMASNASKPFQTQLIQEAGFLIPDTLVTTDPDAVQEFAREHESLIYKSVSGIRSIVSRFKPEDLSRLELLRWCPTQFQEYIPGADFRVHVIGKVLFATQIVSTADDYRYAHRQGLEARVEAVTLPEELRERCFLLAEHLKLTVAGIDLRQTPDGCWYCFEVNPSPGFSYYEKAAGQPIAAAIATLLASTLRG